MRLTQRLKRLAFHLPWHYSIARQILSRRSEVSLEESRFLGHLIQNAPPELPIIEIGTLFGGSTSVMTLFKHQHTPLITIDGFQWNPYGLTPRQHAAITREILSDAIASHNVTLMEMDKEAFYTTYSGPTPGLVFLDANHHYGSTKRDIEWARSVGAHSICGHDYSPQFPGVVQAVDEAGGPARLVETLFELPARES